MSAYNIPPSILPSFPAVGGNNQLPDSTEKEPTKPGSLAVYGGASWSPHSQTDSNAFLVDINFLSSLNAIRRIAKLVTEHRGDGPHRRSKILEEAFEFFSSIKDTPRDGNVENLPLFKELRATGAGVKYKQRLEQFAKEWTNACKDDDNRRKLSNSITMKLQVQQNMAQQNTAQVSVRVLLREDLWSRPNQIIERECAFKYFINSSQLSLKFA
ncbi:hypothetical protein C8R43DRAFT_959688 [Mycena crocata]|nr:hypothetical protein C8R43DRAFT_959688 [Mycena crocata]